MATASAKDAEKVREALRELGTERERSEQDRERVTEAINKELALIGKVGISKTEAAQLLGLHRTTLYRVYKV